MTPEEQLDQWVAGNSIHNDEFDECCPDLSCCQNDYKAPVEERILFRDRPELRVEMLLTFMIKAFEPTGRKIIFINAPHKGDSKCH